ncbi:urea amidolyase related protein [Methylocella silvestris BL2]|uniref:Urea amidolyase related protein n=1 Tax=Methylocella silvestris (strain DSM 15510 / CIP 108128 / LMG 27833 / NCIMB 13906 / BL2) TaxID=395965 RepID=B8ESL4_METSB|nr:biotin-dependent carboxyltransferase family protein [Methylocella silvestris]ACK50349.1 urea amidolyase related protein [Methylocella silvestris BL2]
MARTLRILGAGPGATIQDAGRTGYMRYGVTPAGPMDPAAFATVAAALENEPHAAAIEISVGGLSVGADDEPLCVAFAGGAFDWRRNGDALPVAARIRLAPGETLSARAGAFGAWAYLAVAGGFETPLRLGSRATHLRSQIGGLEGRMLRAGDALPCGSGALLTEAALDAPWLASSVAPIRVLPGPQDDYFAPEALAAFFGEVFTLTPRADRMAYAFSGPPIDHARGYNIVSDGVALGAIQIAGDRAPLILMADRQPTGGYPKLGHVIGADIGRLAQLRPGERCRFKAVGLGEALAAQEELQAQILTTEQRLRPLVRRATTEALLRANLIDGATDALAD